jgi:hypothetical protein
MLKLTFNCVLLKLYLLFVLFYYLLAYCGFEFFSCVYCCNKVLQNVKDCML